MLPVFDCHLVVGFIPMVSCKKALVCGLLNQILPGNPQFRFIVLFAFGESFAAWRRELCVPYISLCGALKHQLLGKSKVSFLAGDA